MTPVPALDLTTEPSRRGKIDFGGAPGQKGILARPNVGFPYPPPPTTSTVSGWAQRFPCTLEGTYPK